VANRWQPDGNAGTHKYTHASTNPHQKRTVELSAVPIDSRLLPPNDPPNDFRDAPIDCRPPTDLREIPSDCRDAEMGCEVPRDCRPLAPSDLREAPILCRDDFVALVAPPSSCCRALASLAETVPSALRCIMVKRARLCAREKRGDERGGVCGGGGV
jgi:hypothetical protein